MITTVSRFHSKYLCNIHTGCWEWQGSVSNPGGYGRFSIGGKTGRHIYAHRYSYLLYNQYIRPGMFICHTCDNPPCVNPNHLFEGTMKDNMQDRNQKGRQFILKGDLHPATKFSESLIKYIRDNKEQYPQTYFTKTYGISRSYVSAIIQGVKRKIVED